VPLADALNWRFSKMTRKAGIGHWHAHEGRHTAVSIMSSNGVPIQDISDTVGHKSTHVTETVYRHVIVPKILTQRRRQAFGESVVEFPVKFFWSTLGMSLCLLGVGVRLCDAGAPGRAVEGQRR
jgi:Phage integrase family